MWKMFDATEDQVYNGKYGIGGLSGREVITWKKRRYITQPKT
jgi:hypothetical protein